MSTTAEVIIRASSDVLDFTVNAGFRINSDGHPLAVVEDYILPLIEHHSTTDGATLIGILVGGWGLTVTPAEYMWNDGDYVYKIDFIEKKVEITHYSKSVTISFDDILTATDLYEFVEELEEKLGEAA